MQVNKSEIIPATCLLLSVVKADDIIKKEELTITKEIISDFFNMDINNTNEILNEALETLNQSTDIFQFGRELNNSFSYQDKLDFICCAYEVAISDGHIDYLEEHMINKIATILNVNHKDLIKAKVEMKKYLD